MENYSLFQRLKVIKDVIMKLIQSPVEMIDSQIISEAFADVVPHDSEGAVKDSTFDSFHKILSQYLYSYSNCVRM